MGKRNSDLLIRKPPQFLTLSAAFSREVDFDESCQKTSAVKHWPHAVAQIFICSFWKRGGMNFLRADINSTTMIRRPSPLPTGRHMGVDRPEVTQQSLSTITQHEPIALRRLRSAFVRPFAPGGGAGNVPPKNFAFNSITHNNNFKKKAPSCLGYTGDYTIQ